MSDLQEGDRCPQEDCDGIMNYERSGECTCHLSPPCHSCTTMVLTCTECGWEET